MGFHGFRSGGAGFGSVAPLVYPTGTATFTGHSTFVALAASVALIAGDASTAAVTASKASFTGGCSFKAVAASVSHPVGAATFAAVSPGGIATFTGAGTIAGRSASVASVTGVATLSSKLARKATFTGTSSISARSASIAPLSGAASLGASSLISLAPITGSTTFAALAASVAPLTGHASIAALHPSGAAFHGYASMVAVRASLATFAGDASFAAVQYVAPATLGTQAVAWTASTDLFNVSRYDNYPFNSIAVVNGYRVGLTSDGAYILSGDDDAGTPINASITTDFHDKIQGKNGPQSSPQLRRPNSLYLDYGTGPLNVTLTVSDSRGSLRQSYTYDVPGGGDEVATWRGLLGRGLRYRYQQITIANVDGAHFTLQDGQMMVDLLSRKI